MTDLIMKENGDYSCYIVTIENPLDYENKMIDRIKAMIDYERQQGIIPNPNTFPSYQSGLSQGDKETLHRASEIIKMTEFNKKMASEYEEAIISEIEKQSDPYVIIAMAAEIISRLEGKGDTYASRVIKAIDSIREEKSEEIVNENTEKAN